MSKKIILGLVLVAGFAACARQQPAVVVDPQPVAITQEPVYTGKYGN